MEKIRVVVADDHPVVRLGICNALRGEADIEVVGQASDGVQAVRLVETLCPDVFILDVQMPEMDGVRVARHVRKHCPGVRVLVLSAFADDRYVFSMLSEGADGYLLKDEAVEDVVDAVRAVAQDETWLSPQIAGKVVQRATSGKHSPDPKPESLTPRETQVLRLMAQGRSNEEIAAALFVTERTARFHVTNLFAKLEASSRIEAVVEAIRRGLVEA